MSGKLTRLGVALGLALTLGACATHHIKYSNPQAAPGGDVHAAKQSFFLWGLVGGSEVDLDKMCPSGVARIDSRTSPVDAILAFFTGGLYSPMSVDVQCSSGTAYRIEREPGADATVAALPVQVQP